MGKGNHKGKVIYHTKVPMDKIHHEVFIPDEIMDRIENRKVFVAGELQKLVAQLFTQFVQPYVVITEHRTNRKQEDGFTRVGTVYTAHLCVGALPMIRTIDGSTVQDIVDSKLISVGNN